MARAISIGFAPGQAFFPFVDSQICQQLTERADRRTARTPRTYVPRVIGTRPGDDLQIPLDLLDRPLIGHAELRDLTELPRALRDLHEDFGDISSGEEETTQNQSRDSKEEWSDKACMDLFEGLLYHSLALLAGRSNATEKAETLKWFFEPDLIWVDKTHPDGSTTSRPVRASCIPFTFQFCCGIVGMRHYLIRDGLLTILQNAGLGDFVPSKNSYE